MESKRSEEKEDEDFVFVDSDGNVWIRDPVEAHCEIMEDQDHYNRWFYFRLLGVTEKSSKLYAHPFLCVFSICVVFVILFCVYPF